MNIGIIGLGKMGEAIAKGLLKARIYSVCYNEKKEKRIEKISNQYPQIKYLSMSQLINTVEIILVSVKPQDIKGLLLEIDGISKEEKLFISICAGISTPFIQSYLRKTRIIRAMPNMGALIGKSFTVITQGESATKEDLDIAEGIFSAVGNVKVVSEDLIDSITAISGSGPAYFVYFLKALRDAAAEIGLSDISEKLVMETFTVTMGILNEMGFSFDELIEKVASPGGTTEACLRFWDQENFSEILKQGIKKARNRAKELGK
ncbi:MAG: pyrroline-5-carboxylate reductase [Candidatus Saelkia tenebricola]|nr:pyrroline-5-carboxylate reductase [Candidatus Saelkia tenebricola]